MLFNESCTKLGIPDPVDAVRVVRDSSSQLGKGFGFVQFSSQQAARAALGCDGQLLRKRPVRVTKAMKVSANLKQLGQKPSRGSDKTSGSRTAPVADGGAGTHLILYQTCCLVASVHAQPVTLHALCTFIRLSHVVSAGQCVDPVWLFVYCGHHQMHAVQLKADK